MTNQILSSLCIITNFHNKQKSILDAFIPMVEYGIYVLQSEQNDCEYGDIDTLQAKIKSSTGIEINKLSLQSLLKKLKRDRKIELYASNTHYKIVEQSMLLQADYLATVRDKNRDVHNFIKNYVDFSQDQRNEDEIIDWIYQFVCTYNDLISISNKNITFGGTLKEYESLISFLEKINHTDTKLTNIFISIFLGFNMCQLLSDNELQIEKPLKNLTVYVDSNFVLRLIDLQEAPFTSETRELYELLKRCKVRIRIFEETIEEIKSVITYYSEVYKKHNDTYKALFLCEQINGVLGAFYRHNFTFTDIDTLIDNIDKEILKYDISIDRIRRYTVSYDEKDIQDLYDTKYEQEIERIPYREKKCEHYIEIINIIKYLRKSSGKPASCLGNSDYVFLTCDLKLYQYNKTNSKKYSFPETISQEMLANDLLLLNPEKAGKLSYSFLTSLYSTSKYLDVHILDNLQKEIIKIQEKNPSASEYIVMATRNAEYYFEFNNIFNDQNDDEAQILQIVEKQKQKVLEKEQVQQEQISLLNEQNAKNAESVAQLQEQLNDKNSQIDAVNEFNTLLEKQLKEAKIKRFIAEIRPKIKAIRWRDYSWKIIGSILSILLTLLLGFETFCEVKLLLKIGIALLTVGVIIYTIVSIVRADDSRITLKAIQKCENKILAECNLTKEDVVPYEKDYK